ncbi:unnamed protein product [Cochlearia groenlandica]
MSSGPQANECELLARNWGAELEALMVSRGHCHHLIKPGGSEDRVVCGRAIEDRELHELRYSFGKDGEFDGSERHCGLASEGDERGGAPFISSFPIPILDRMLRKMRFTELPVSIRILYTTKLAMSSDMTRASSCGLVRRSFSLSSKGSLRSLLRSRYPFSGYRQFQQRSARFFRPEQPLRGVFVSDPLVARERAAFPPSGVLGHRKGLRTSWRSAIVRPFRRTLRCGLRWRSILLVYRKFVLLKLHPGCGSMECVVDASCFVDYDLFTKPRLVPKAMFKARDRRRICDSGCDAKGGEVSLGVSGSVVGRKLNLPSVADAKLCDPSGEWSSSGFFDKAIDLRGRALTPCGFSSLCHVSRFGFRQSLSPSRLGPLRAGLRCGRIRLLISGVPSEFRSTDGWRFVRAPSLWRSARRGWRLPFAARK